MQSALWLIFLSLLVFLIVRAVSFSFSVEGRQRFRAHPWRHSLSIAGLLIFLALFAGTAFPTLCLPSQRQRECFFYPKSARVLECRRVSPFPFLGRDQVVAMIGWPEDIDFTDWYNKTLAETKGIHKFSVSDDSVTATVQRHGRTVEITAELRDKTLLIYRLSGIP